MDDLPIASLLLPANFFYVSCIPLHSLFYNLQLEGVISFFNLIILSYHLRKIYLKISVFAFGWSVVFVDLPSSYKDISICSPTSLSETICHSGTRLSSYHTPLTLVTRLTPSLPSHTTSLYHWLFFWTIYAHWYQFRRIAWQKNKDVALIFFVKLIFKME